jgi:hypothetical protein
VEGVADAVFGDEAVEDVEDGVLCTTKTRHGFYCELDEDRGFSRSSLLAKRFQRRSSPYRATKLRRAPHSTTRPGVGAELPSGQSSCDEERGGLGFSYDGDDSCRG